MLEQDDQEYKGIHKQEGIKGSRLNVIKTYTLDSWADTNQKEKRGQSRDWIRANIGSVEKMGEIQGDNPHEKKSVRRSCYTHCVFSL